ncbi:MAG: hypothetical protein ACJAU0_000393 [Flavobacteriales bacterium]|jgi:hypothetical protein
MGETRNSMEQLPASRIDLCLFFVLLNERFLKFHEKNVEGLVQKPKAQKQVANASLSRMA